MINNFNKWLTSLSLFIASILMTGCAGKYVKVFDEDLSVVGTLKAQRYTLKNGLKLVVVEDHSSPTFAFQTWFDVGSRDEEIGKTGLAHLFEHMMFKATKNYPEGQFDRILDAAGVEGKNAFTSRDYTAYIQELSSDNLDLIGIIWSI